MDDLNFVPGLKHTKSLFNQVLNLNCGLINSQRALIVGYAMRDAQLEMCELDQMTIFVFMHLQGVDKICPKLTAIILKVFTSFGCTRMHTTCSKSTTFFR